MGISIGSTATTSSVGSLSVSSAPPSDTTKIWLDTSGTPTWKKYDELTGTWKVTEVDDSDENFTFIQSTPSNTWVIQHSMNRMPSIHIVDSTGEEVMGNIVYNSESQITITFSEAIEGKAYLS